MTKISKVIVFFTFSLYLFTILGIPLCKYVCHLKDSPIPDIRLMQVCCVNTVENSSINNELKGNALIPYKHNNCDCENGFGFICLTDKHTESIIGPELQKKFLKLPFLHYENTTSDFIAKESFYLLYSPHVNSTHFSIRSVVLLI